MNIYGVMADYLRKIRSVTKSLVRVHKWSGRTAYVRHKQSGRTNYDNKNGPTRAKLVRVINFSAKVNLATRHYLL